MSAPPDLTVVIQARNRPDLLANAIDSVLTQLGRIEVVLVADGDNATYVSDNAATARDAVCIVSGSGLGAAAARNLGATHASGRFLSFLDEEDYWLPGRASSLLACFEVSPGLDWVYHPTTAVGDHDRGSGAFTILRDPVARFLCHDPPHLDGLVVRRDVHREVQFDDELAPLDDLDYLIRLAAHGDGAMLDRVLAEIGSDPSTRTRVPPAVLLDAWERFWRKHDALLARRRVRSYHLVRLGDMYEESEQHAESKASFTRAVLQRPQSRIAWKRLLGLREQSTRPHPVFATASLSKPSFFIVGAQKSGTTSLYHYLKQHPEIFLPARVEMSFFSDAHQRPSIANLEEYLSFFDEAGDRTTGEKSAIYLFSDEVPRRLRAFSTDSKAIIMLRNPVELIASLHRQFLYTGNEDLIDLEDALAAAEQRAQGNKIPRGAHLVRFLQYKEVARLAPQVERYEEVLGKERVLVVLLEDLIVDPGDTYRTVLEFLGVGTDFAPEFKKYNPAKRVPNLTLRRGARLSRGLNRVIHAVMPMAFVTEMRKMFSKLQPQPIYPIPDALHNKLIAEFEEDIRALETLIDRDLSHWLVPRGG